MLKNYNMKYLAVIALAISLMAAGCNISNAPEVGLKKQQASFVIERSTRNIKLTIPPIVVNQSACIWKETSPDYATGANIFTTQSADTQGNSHAYDYGQDVTVSAFCQDKFGDSGEVYIKAINIKDIK